MSKEPTAPPRDATNLTVLRQERILRADLSAIAAAFGEVMLDRICRRNDRPMATITDLAEYRRTHR